MPERALLVLGTHVSKGPSRAPWKGTQKCSPPSWTQHLVATSCSPVRKDNKEKMISGQSRAQPHGHCSAVRCVSSTLSWTATSSAGDKLSWEPWGLETGFWKGQWVEPLGLHRGERARMLLWRPFWLKKSRKHHSNLMDLSVTETEGKGRKH